MRVIAHVERSLDGAIVPKMQPKLLFFGLGTRHKAIRRKHARRVPRFFSEAEAQRRTLGPGLPHHRHPMTLDEFLAGGFLFFVVAAAAFICGWCWL